MSKVIFKLKFQSPNFKNTKMNNMYHLLYIGTREGVALNDDIKEFENNNSKSSNDEYMEYIANRPRSHGLFTKEGVNVNIKEMADEMKNYNGYVYRGIVSLRELEAIEKGFDKKENWETLVRDKMLYISKQLNIPYSQLKWVGAFHRESGHPHIHLMMWNDKQEVRNIGAIPKRNIEAIRKELTDEIFSNEKENVLSLKNVYREFLTDTTKWITSNNDYNDKFLELDEKVNEINVKYEVKKLEEDIRVLNKEISESDDIEVINKKKALIDDIENKIQENNKRIDVYDIKDKIKSLENVKDIRRIEKEIILARDKGQVDKYENYINQARFDLGIVKLQRDRKICLNKKDVVNMKCDLVALENKKRMFEIEDVFNTKEIDINSINEETLEVDLKNLKSEYNKLKSETENIIIKDFDELEDKIFNLSNTFEKNKWILDKDPESSLILTENGKEYVNHEYLSELNQTLDNKVTELTDKINELKEKPLNELERFKDNKDFEDDVSLYHLEKKLASIKEQYGIKKKEEELKKLKGKSKEDITSDKIKELQEKLEGLEKMIDIAPGEDVELIRSQITQIKNEIESEKESFVDKELLKLEVELELAKDEIGVVEVEFNDFILEDRMRGKTLEEIGEMIVELQVPKEGRLQYKLMPPQVKAAIDRITDKILQMPQYRKMYEGYIKSVEDLTKLYTSNSDDIEQAKLNAKEDIYKRIGNNILKAKKDIVVSNKKPDFAVQRLLTSIAKMFSTNTNKNNKTKLISAENSKAERKKQMQENKARGLYSEHDLE